MNPAPYDPALPGRILPPARSRAGRTRCRPTPDPAEPVHLPNDRTLTDAPWTLYLSAAAQPDTPPEFLDFLAHFPYQIAVGLMPQPAVNLASTAAATGTSLTATCLAMKTLTDQGFLRWDSANHAVRLASTDTTPLPTDN